MRKAVIFFVLLLIVSYATAQVRPPLAFKEMKEGLNPIDEIPLFDLEEIKRRKIDTAYIVYHPASWAEYHPQINPCNCSYNDTLSRYVFDTQGRIREETSFQILGYTTIAEYDSIGRRIRTIHYDRKKTSKIPAGRKHNYEIDTFSFKQHSLRTKEGNDSVITLTTFLRFNHGLDTATIEMKKYNSRGKLIEEISSVNERNKKELDDDTGDLTYHFRYDYDSLGRLIYYRDLRSNRYKKFSYPFYGKQTDIYTLPDHKLLESDMKWLTEENGTISITFEKSQIILSPLEKGSKLFKLQTIVDIGELPVLYYKEITYKIRK